MLLSSTRTSRPCGGSVWSVPHGRLITDRRRFPDVFLGTRLRGVHIVGTRSTFLEMTHCSAMFGRCPTPSSRGPSFEVVDALWVHQLKTWVVGALKRQNAVLVLMTMFQSSRLALLGATTGHALVPCNSETHSTATSSAVLSARGKTLNQLEKKSDN